MDAPALDVGGCAVELMRAVMSKYQSKFSQKIHADQYHDSDALMEAFGITPKMKQENMQYWGRELGMCWQSLVISLCGATRTDCGGPVHIGSFELCDLTIGNIAVDTKYRIGSGDSGTLRKLQLYASMLRDMGYKPMMLIFRHDNLPSAISACKAGGWDVVFGKAAIAYLDSISGMAFADWLKKCRASFTIQA